MSERMKMPPERNFGFYQRKKHDKWHGVPLPEPLPEYPVADSHAHIHMLPDPAWELVRCAANDVRFICVICDPSEDKISMPDDLHAWTQNAREMIACADGRLFDQELLDGDSLSGALPQLCMAAGVHPHNASLYNEEVEALLLSWLSAPEALVVGEIGLDYHYDLSPRDAQRRVFRRQIQLAKELDLPIALHLRGGAAEEGGNAEDGAAVPDAVPSNAHQEAFEILQEEGFPPRGTILHCCTLPPDELRPWIEAGCYIAYGGALTFKPNDAAREGAKLVPEEQLLLETDTPYMAPHPMRGATCTPAHIIFNAAYLAEIRGIAPGPDRKRFLEQLAANTRRFFSL